MQPSLLKYRDAVKQLSGQVEFVGLQTVALDREAEGWLHETEQWSKLQAIAC